MQSHRRRRLRAVTMPDQVADAQGRAVIARGHRNARLAAGRGVSERNPTAAWAVDMRRNPLERRAERRPRSPAGPQPHAPPAQARECAANTKAAAPLARSAWLACRSGAVTGSPDFPRAV